MMLALQTRKHTGVVPKCGILPNALREQALELLRRGWPGGGAPRFDADAALVLCRMRGFAPGLLFLYERMRLHREVLQAG